MGRGLANGMAPPQRMSVLPLTFTLALTLTVTLTLHSAVAHDNCQLIPVRESIVKEMTLTHANRHLQVSCTAEVNLHKCEGQCESKVTPSVVRHRGFRKDCRCCKEGRMGTRTVVLPRCFHDGELIRGLEGTAEVIDLRSCGCYACSN